MSEPTEGIDYEVLDHPTNPEWSVVRILGEKYKGITLKFGQLSFASEENEDGSTNCNFDYEVLENAEFKTADLETDTEFFHLLGDILMNILHTNLENSPEQFIDEEVVIVED